MQLVRQVASGVFELAETPIKSMPASHCSLPSTWPSPQTSQYDSWMSMTIDCGFGWRRFDRSIDSIDRKEGADT